MHRTWQLQEAKAHFSEVIRACHNQGPQEITVRGHLTAVVLSVADYRRLATPKQRFVDFMQQSPFVGLNMDFERDQSPAAEVDL